MDIKKFFKNSITGLTLDLIPGNIDKYYVFNEDKSGFYTPNKYAWFATSESVYYPIDSLSDVEAERKDRVKKAYQINLITALIAWFVAFLFLLIPVAGIILAPIALYVTYFVAGMIVTLMTFNKEALNSYVLLTIDAGLAQYSNNSDRLFARSSKQRSAENNKAMKDSDDFASFAKNSPSAKLRKEASDKIRARI